QGAGQLGEVLLGEAVHQRLAEAGDLPGERIARAGLVALDEAPAGVAARLRAVGPQLVELLLLAADDLAEAVGGRLAGGARGPGSRHGCRSSSPGSWHHSTQRGRVRGRAAAYPTVRARRRPDKGRRGPVARLSADGSGWRRSAPRRKGPSGGGGVVESVGCVKRSADAPGTSRCVGAPLDAPYSYSYGYFAKPVGMAAPATIRASNLPCGRPAELRNPDPW